MTVGCGLRSQLQRVGVVSLLLLGGAKGVIKCPGSIEVKGYGKVEIIPTGWDTDGAGEISVNSTHVVPTMSTRMYFAETCSAGKYSYKEYTAAKLLGKVMTFTADLTGAGCGCNAAFYLTSMAQNTHKSECGDYYCDANNVCNERCAEIDIMEANQFAYHATLHAAADGDGAAVGFGGGGAGWNGPRNWTAQEYGPRGTCIDTNKPFHIEVSFPVDASGQLQAMQVTLKQEASKCPLTGRIESYAGMAEMSKALEVGMTPIISYWADDDMLWMDGEGDDCEGPCKEDKKSKCAKSVKLYDFSLADLEDAEEQKLEDLAVDQDKREEEDRAQRPSPPQQEQQDDLLQQDQQHQQQSQEDLEQQGDRQDHDEWQQQQQQQQNDGQQNNDMQSQNDKQQQQQQQQQQRQRQEQHQSQQYEIQKDEPDDWSSSWAGSWSADTSKKDTKETQEKQQQKVESEQSDELKEQKQHEQKTKDSSQSSHAKKPAWWEESLPQVEKPKASDSDLLVFAQPPSDADTADEAELHWLAVNRRPDSAQTEEARAAERYKEYMKKYDTYESITRSGRRWSLMLAVAFGCSALAVTVVLLTAHIRRLRASVVSLPGQRRLPPSASSSQLLGLGEGQGLEATFV